MGILTLALATSVGLAISCYTKKTKNHENLKMIKSLGLFAFVFGMLGQFIGLYSALSAIAQMNGAISPTLMVTGIRISSITTIYGMLIFVISYMMWFALKALNSKKELSA